MIDKFKAKSLKLKTMSGQAMLVAMLIIFVAAMAIGIAVATVAMAQTQIGQNQKASKQAYNLAASGIENALMRMTKGDFTNPEPLSQGGNSCTINIESIGGSLTNYRVLSIAQVANPLTGIKKVFKKIQAELTIVDGVITVTSYQEVY
ncbi:hypothetical protein A2V71_03845 [Candidatus Berkelbacteria bacterium RBG_13_40_8]|uniref:Type 4 fimbrial biogenesis protein PilX N-terminal domain-containing protein n=1 Tax=Candidatus Berkelbacteria bacterium RBG_13_40_8 TaxID=1797467 RepID=A0A1F5DLZ8_9BACT|nr:MAG: hypothetical protein A2V71_03845 [Candidatus Berkelbacteria bacterium RBG_13_40_8]